MASTPEGRIKAKIDTVLKANNVFYYCPVAGPYGTNGVPDRVAIVNGQFVGIEAKSDASKSLSKLQEKMMEKILSAGGMYFVVCDDTSLKALKAWIENANR